MRPKNYKRTSTVKKTLAKSDGVVKLCDKLQIAYAEKLDAASEVIKIQCNVPLDMVEDGSYTTDFLCQRADQSWFVRECVFLKKLCLPRISRLLEESRQYWYGKGISDWGLVVDKEESVAEE